MSILSTVRNPEELGRVLISLVSDLKPNPTASDIKTRQAQLAAYYRNLRGYHNGETEAFRDRWMQARGQSRLPVNIRAVSAVAPAVAAWWADNLFGTAWTQDGLAASDGRQNVLAYDDAPEEVRLAVQQAFTWGGDVLSDIRNDVPRLGNGLIEIRDDRSWRNGKPNPSGNDVHPVWVSPEYVVDIAFSDQGFIRSYHLAIPTKDPETQRDYLYEKIVTRDEFVTLRDGHEYEYDGEPARRENLFGFVPAVNFIHQPLIAGEPFGVPAIHNGVATLNEYQKNLSDVSDYIARLVRQPVLLETEKPKEMIEYLLAMRGYKGQQAVQMDSGMAAELRAMQDREEIKYQPAPKGTVPHAIMQDLGLGDSDPHIGRLESEILRIFPEIALDQRFSAHSQMSGEAAAFILGTVQTKLARHAERYNRSIVRVGQMCCTMGGVLIRNGDWGPRSGLTKNQQKFLPFDLQSFDNGALDFGLRVPQLKPKTFAELAGEAIQLETIQTPAGLRHLGFSDAEIYGTDAKGNALAPNPRPGILQDAGKVAQGEVAADVSSLLQRALNTGVAGR